MGSRYLVRGIEDVIFRDDALDLHLRCVGYDLLHPLPGLITSESAAAQGLERKLPNAPASLGGDDALDWGPAQRQELALLRVRAADSGILRLTLVCGELATRARSGDWPQSADGMADGILVDPSPGESGISLEETKDSVLVSTPALRLELARRPFAWQLSDAAGRVLSRSGGDRRQVAGFPYAPALGFGDGCTWASFELAPDEKIVGLGEHFGPLVRNGQRLELVATDALGAGTGEAYKAAPLLHSSAGFSAFFHSPGPLEASVGAPYPSVMEVCNEEAQRLDLFLLAGSDLKGRLSAYTALTGRASLPPRWALGAWMSRCRYRTRSELEAAARGMREHQVPCDVVHIDPDWLERDLLNCDFVWSVGKYPDPKAMIAGLREQGFRTSVWELPYIDPQSTLYEEARAAGYLVRDDNGEPARVARTFSRDGRPRGMVDFSNPAARRWWKEHNKALVGLGVSVIKCDFGEGLPDDARMTDGRPGRAWRNLYPLWYNRTVAESLAESLAESGEEASIIWSRSGWAGSQRYPAQWGGDPEASVAGLAAELRGGLSWSLSAPGLWAHDIGGFYGEGPSPSLYIRWAQVGCLSPLTRFHGLGPREPWEFGEPALSIVRQFVRLRYKLLPYLMSAAGEACRFGWPVMRPLLLEFPDLPALWQVSHEYMLGPDLLVVAVLDDSSGPVDVRVELPPGEWVDFWSGEVHAGPACFVERVPLERIPLYVRSGAVIPMGREGAHTGEIPAGEWELHCFGLPAGELGALTTVYEGQLEHGYRPERGGSSSGGASIRCSEQEPRAVAGRVHLPGGQVVEAALKAM